MLITIETISIILIAALIIFIKINDRNSIKKKNKPIRVELIDVIKYWLPWEHPNEAQILVLKSLEDNNIYLLDGDYCNVSSYLYTKFSILKNITFTGEFKMFIPRKNAIISNEDVINRPMFFNEKGNLWIKKIEKRTLNLDNVYQVEKEESFPFQYSKTFYKVNKETDKSILKDAKFVKAVVEFDIEEKYK